MVGDTPFDAAAANPASVAAVGLLCGGFSEGALLKAGCKAVYRDPAESQSANILLDRISQADAAIWVS
jgi:phosphoglycolate phosphatase-like HAD superfamily hydrolase